MFHRFQSCLRFVRSASFVRPTLNVRSVQSNRRTFQVTNQSFWRQVAWSIPIGCALATPIFCQQQLTQDERVHVATGLKFPELITDYLGKAEKLIGLGLKTVTFLSFQVYVAGIYVEEQFTTQFKASKNQDAQAIIDKIIKDTSIAKSLRITSCRSIGGNHLRDGFGRVLDKYALQISDEKQKSEILKDLGAFKAHFPKGQIQRNESMLFTAYENKLTIQFEGKTLGVIESPFLCEYLFIAYLGDKPATKETKDSVINGIQSLLT